MTKKLLILNSLVALKQLLSRESGHEWMILNQGFGKGSHIQYILKIAQL